MKYKVAIKKEKELEQYWLLRAILDSGTQKTVIKEKEYDFKPTLNIIGEFLENTGATFVSVAENFRWSDMELPFE